jgi:ribonuclease-3
LYHLFVSRDRDFSRRIRRISGFAPQEPFLYQLALTHSSTIGKADSDQSAKECNERLEFLGDSILDAVISEYLFKIYPTKDEGFLTEMRSKIVNRKSLNKIARKLNLDHLIRHNQSGSLNSSMHGDALEAFIGAVYMDLGYRRTRRFIHNRIMAPYIQLHLVEDEIISHKNKLIEYVQKQKLGLLEFEVLEEKGDGRGKIFKVQAKVGNRELGIGEGKNKKSAEQHASENALVKLKLI